MSGIGSLRWLNDYIGIPYRFGGRDIDGVDCYGLCKLIYENEFEETLPDWTFDEIDLSLFNKEIVKQVSGGTFEQLEEPQDSCFAICYRTRAAHHMGLFFGNGIIHCTDNAGTVYEPRRRFEEKYTKIVYGHWHP